jgi:hypothetical protein
MHYANGRTAKLGDVVRGKGYNVKHEIIGVLTSAQPQATACNCTVACVTQSSQFCVLGWKERDREAFSFPRRYDTSVADANTPIWPGQLIVGEVRATLEYGQLDAFVALDPMTGEVLPPEI